MNPIKSRLVRPYLVTIGGKQGTVWLEERKLRYLVNKKGHTVAIYGPSDSGKSYFEGVTIGKR